MATCKGWTKKGSLEEFYNGAHLEDLGIRGCRRLQQEWESGELATWNGSTERGGKRKLIYLRHKKMWKHRNLYIIKLLFIYWLVCFLLAGPDLWKRMPLKCSINMVFTCPLLSLCKISSPFRENKNMVVFPFPFHIFMPLANLWFIRLPILRTRSCPDLYPFIRLQEDHWHLKEGKSLSRDSFSPLLY